MSDHVDARDVHLVRQGQAIVPRVQKFEAPVRASTARLRIAGGGLVHPGQTACHRDAGGHRRDAARPVSAEAAFVDPGPGRLRVGGSRIVTRAGTLRICCVFSPVRGCKSAVRGGSKVIRLRVGGAAPVIGRI